LKQRNLAFLFFLIFKGAIWGQDFPPPDRLFYETNPLEIALAFSAEEVKVNTNDSTLIDIPLLVHDQNQWDTLQVSIRARGNFRRSTCFFPPIRMEIKKKQRSGTLFENYKKTKIVFPCLIQEEMNDNVLQEFIAYKLYELISPYHFKTRALILNYTDLNGGNSQKYTLRGFLIEDDSRIAKRTFTEVFKKYIHPKALDAEGAIQNAMFQFFLGNTDFSMAYQHNGKLLQVGEAVVPVPYDFDMSGWVNPSYAVANTALGINSVKDRVYRGYERDPEMIQKVRQQYLEAAPYFYDIIGCFENKFDAASEFEHLMDYTRSFFTILESDALFKEKVIDQLRTR